MLNFVARAPVSAGFLKLMLRSYDYNMHVEGLLPANLCLVTLLSWGKRLQFKSVHLQHIQTVNKTSSLLSHVTSHYKLLRGQIWTGAGILPLTTGCHTVCDSSAVA